MKELSEKGAYSITEDMRDKLTDFTGGYADEPRTERAIREIYGAHSYVCDTHTAVAAAVYEDYFAATGDETQTVIASTASPYKFARSVVGAIEPEHLNLSDMELIERLKELSGVEIPQAIEDIRSAPVLHDIVCSVEAMPDEVRKFLS